MNEIKKQKTILSGLSKLFRELDKDKKEVIPKSKRRGYIDPASVCMIIPKTQEFKRTLLNNFEVEETKIPKLDYKLDKIETGLEIKSKYATDYLNILLNLNKVYDSVIIKIKPNYPLWVETEDFIFILAPRLEVD